MDVKILDFGLAKLTEIGSGIDAETRTGGRIPRKARFTGTIAYMSPEQAEGKKLSRRGGAISSVLARCSTKC